MKEAATATVTVEVTTWVTKLVGGDGSGRRLLEEPVRPGDTVGDVLRRRIRAAPTSRSSG